MEVSAFEMQKMTFSHPSNKANAVTVEFKGAVLNPALPILTENGKVSDKELRKFHAFFKKMHAMNVKGDKDSVLSIWAPRSRDAVATGMTDEALTQNQAQFDAVSAMTLNKVIHYGNYYICFVEMAITGQKPFVMKYPVEDVSGELYLTNGMNGDYFYELMSHYLDKTNFEAMLRQ